MKASSLSLALILFAASTSASLAEAPCRDCTPASVDWTTLPSTFSHREGYAVDRYDRGVTPVTYSDSLRTTSIYRHHRSSLQGVNSADHYHRVDQFGPPVVPYGEWRYPYRPYSVPYDAWGTQLPQVYSPTQFDLNTGNGRGGPRTPNGYDPTIRYGDPSQIDPRYGDPRYDERANGSRPFGFPPLIPGPRNALPAAADEYYPEPPEPKPLSDRDFFYSPIRP